MPGPRYTAQCAYDASHPAALAVYCSDGRFTDSVEELLRHLGHPRLDTVTMPGGPGLLDLSTAGISILEATRRGIDLLVRAHGTKHAVLLAHEGCGYYRHRYPMETPAEILKQQIDDLRVAARWFRSVHDHVELLLYFARTKGGPVSFEPVEEAPAMQLFGAQPSSPPPVPVRRSGATTIQANFAESRRPGSTPPPVPKPKRRK